MKKPHYSWIICAGGTLLLLCTNGLTANILPIYLPFLEEAGYSGAQSSAMVSLRCLAGMLGMLLVGPFYRRVSLRLGLSLCCLLTGVGFGLMALADSYLWYCLGAAAAGISYGLGAMIPVSLLIGRWFANRRATAIGICSAGTGLSSMIFPPVVTALAENYSLGLSFWAVAGFSLLVAGVTVLLLRNDPADKGLLAYGYAQAEADEKAHRVRPGGQRRDLPRRVQLVMLAALALLGGLSMSTSSHYSVLFTTEGHSKASVALCISVFGVMLTGSKFVFGAVVDRLGGRKATILFELVLAAGCGLCCLAGSGAGFMLAGVILMGAGFPPSTVGISVWAEEFSSPARYARVLRNFQMAYTGGGMLLSAVPGWVYDVTGSYVNSYAAATALFLAFLCVLLGVYRSRDRADAGAEAEAKVQKQ